VNQLPQQGCAHRCTPHGSVSSVFSGSKTERHSVSWGKLHCLWHRTLFIDYGSKSLFTMYDTYYLPGTIAITIKKDRTIPSAVTDGRQRIRSRPHLISRGACIVLPLHDVQHLSCAGATTTETAQLQAGPLDLIQAAFADWGSEYMGEKPRSTCWT
jgi:hypothetical protein